MGNKQRSIGTLSGLVMLLLAGCGGGDHFDTAYVEGTVVCNGEPMSTGLLILTPIRPDGLDKKVRNIGKPARALIQEDGSFTLGTYYEDDGAVIGKHKVHLNMDEIPDDAPQQPCYKCAPNLVVEVKEGSNNLKIDLVHGVIEDEG